MFARQSAELFIGGPRPTGVIERPGQLKERLGPFRRVVPGALQEPLQQRDRLGPGRVVSRQLRGPRDAENLRKALQRRPRVHHPAESLQDGSAGVVGSRVFGQQGGVRLEGAAPQRRASVAGRVACRL